jgi:membrane protease YdiL (CAAX protease family)
VTRRALSALLILVAGIAAWAVARHLPTPARALTTMLLVPLPLFMRWQARESRASALLVPRSAVYLGSALLLWALASLTALAARASHLGMAELGLAGGPVPRLLAWSAATYGAGVAVLALGRLLHLPETPMVRHLIPATGLEKLAFAGLSLTAGFAEELVYRGFLLWALTRASGSLAFGVIGSSVVFGIMHAYQDMSGAARAAVLGAVLAMPVLATGSLIPAMVAHAAVDLTSGFLLARWLLSG